MVQNTDHVRAAFVEPEEFWSSPLYRRLCTVVAADPYLIELAAHARAGQGPTFAFFGAVHALLLAGVDHPLADHYPSVRRATPDPAAAGPALTAFAHEHAAAIRDILSSRLVQTNHVQRALALRLGLAAVAAVSDEPVHLLEVGCSAGLVLRHERYGYHLGARSFGDPASPVQLVTDWRSTLPVPDLDAVPPMATVSGIDLHPLDPSDEDDRRWLEALVWPEDRSKAELLGAALTLAEGDPVRMLTGDAIDLCPVWAAEVPAGEPRVVFHCATRMHVPVDRQGLFDDAIARTGADGPLYRIAVEGDGLMITMPGGRPTRTYDVDGHLAWAAPA